MLAGCGSAKALQPTAQAQRHVVSVVGSSPFRPGDILKPLASNAEVPREEILIQGSSAHPQMLVYVNFSGSLSTGQLRLVRKQGSDTYIFTGTYHDANLFGTTGRGMRIVAQAVGPKRIKITQSIFHDPVATFSDQLFAVS
jgi:hypothetical protein